MGKNSVLVLAACALVLTAPAGGGMEPPSGAEGQEVQVNDTVFGKALRFERAISGVVSSTTGLAISPLLGMGVLGAWQYWREPAAVREGLPWYTHPVVWGICLSLFLLRILKDTVGMVIPELLKKPLTVLEVMENQLSAAVVALAVLPASAAAALPGLAPPIESGWGGGGSGTGLWAVLPVTALGPFLLLVPMLALFAVVSTVSHAVKCLLLLSPSNLVTAGVKCAKGGCLAAFAVTAYLMPWVGIAASLAILFVCARLFGWAFRWNVYGTLFAWDFFAGRCDRALGDGESLQGFLLEGAPGVPARTYGSIRRDGEELEFSYRPWLIFPVQTRRISLSGAIAGVRKGLLFPSITLRMGAAERPRTLMEMRLRYRNHEDAISTRLRAAERLPSRVIQGARDALAWFWEQVRMDQVRALERPSAN